MKIEFEKELVEALVKLYGKEQAVNELIAACKVIIDEGVKELGLA